MSVARTAARRAWALSLTLHAATLAGLFALPPRTPPARNLRATVQRRAHHPAGRGDSVGNLCL